MVSTMIPTCRVFSGDVGGGQDYGADLASAFERAEELGRKSGETVTIAMGGGDYYFTRPTAVSLPGLRWYGKGRGSRVHVTSTTGAVTLVPSTTSGSYRSIITEALGVYVEAHRGTICREAVISDMTFMGLESTPSVTSAEWFGVLVAGSRPTLKDVWIEQRTSTAKDATNKSEYKSLNQRSVSQYFAVGFGESKWVSPDPYRAFPVTHLVVDKVHILGEPLVMNGEAATMTTTAKFTPIWCRKVVGGSISRVTFSDGAAQTGTVQWDIVFTGNPANNDAIVIPQWNPYTRVTENKTYTFKTSPSGSYEVQRDGSTANTSLRALVAKINVNCIEQGGNDFNRALYSDKLVGDSTVALLRVENVPIKVAGYDGNFSTWSQGISAPSVSVGSFATIRATTSTNRIYSYYDYGILIEDSPFLGVQDCEVVGSSFAKYGLCWLSTLQHNIFTYYEWAEGHHHTIDNFRGDGFVYGSGGIGILGSGFFNTGKRMQIGQHGTVSDSAALYVIDTGNNKGKQLVLTSSNFSNNETVVIDDNQGNSRTFRARTSVAGAQTGYDFIIGADAEASLNALRLVILERAMDKLVRCYITELASAAGGGTFTLIVNFFAFKDSYTPTITDTASALTVNDYSVPYRCGYGTIQMAAHGALGSDSLCAPVVKATKVYSRLTISGTVDHQLPRPTSNFAQEYFICAVSADLAVVTDPGTSDGFVVNGKTFLANTGSDLTPANTYYCGVPSGATAALRAKDFAKKFAAKVNSVGESVTGAFALYVTDSPVPLISVLRGATGTSATYVTAVNANTLAARNGSGASGAPGATVAQQGARAPIVLDDCRFTHIKGVEAFPICASGYASVSSFVEAYGAPTAITDAGNDQVINAGFGGGPMQLLYATKSSSDVVSEVVMEQISLAGVWGAGRTFPTKLYDVGGSMSASDIVVKPGCSVKLSVST